MRDLSAQSDWRSSISQNIPQPKKPFSIWPIDISHVISKRMRGYGSEDGDYASSGEALYTLPDCLITFSKADYKVRRDPVSAKYINCIIECLRELQGAKDPDKNGGITGIHRSHYILLRMHLQNKLL